MTDPTHPTFPPAARWIDAVDVRLGVWLTVAGVLCGAGYAAETWDHPHRSAIIALLAASLVSAAIVAPAAPWLLRHQRRAELFFPVWSLGYVLMLVVLCALDGGSASPIRAFLFVPVAFAALAYPARSAMLVAIASVLAFAGLALAGGLLEDSGALVVGGALACTAALGIRQARRERARRRELTLQRDTLRASEQLFRGGFEHSPVGMALIDTDGRYVQVNDALCRLLGRPRRWLQDQSFRDVTHPDDRAYDEELVARLTAGELDHAQYEKRYVHADGSIVHVLLGESLIRDAGGQIRFFHAQVVDITAQREATERAHGRARQQAVVAAIGQRALEGAPLSELFEEAVAAMEDTLGVTHAAVAQLLPDERAVLLAARGYTLGFSVPVDSTTSQIGLARASGMPVLMDDALTEVRFDSTVARDIGMQSGLTVLVPGPEGSPFGALVTHAPTPRFFEADDVSFLQMLANVLGSALSREAAQERLRHLSLHDALTGLPNRALLLDRLGHALARARRTDEVLAVMFLDVDHFKTVNDAFGHTAGDDLLRALTPRLLEALRVGDTLARFGGDEFVVLCEGMRDAPDALALAERLLAVFATPFVLEHDNSHPTEHHLSASIGIAVAGAEHAGDPDALIRDADIAMYRAKQGRGRVELFDQRSRTRVVERVRTTSELRRALDEEELFVVYQPIVDLRDGCVRRLEALLRWQHPERGLVSPVEFIPLAEESGLILPIGEWVIETVVRQLAAWDASGDPRLQGLRSGLNLSARQLIEPGLVDVVTAILGRHGLAPDRIVCEITETALIDDPVRASDNVTELAAAGVLVSLDDFCTGYSALEHLKRFPLCAIKLDRTFVADVATSPIDMAIVRGLVEMATAMRISTVAEGIETPEQLARLRELGCELAQGFLFAAPLTPSALTELLHGLPEQGFDLAGMHAASRVAAS
jgi:diguanylate cyclase (GGDEF)-like protein/PAS domain S-box-containing protein